MKIGKSDSEKPYEKEVFFKMLKTFHQQMQEKILLEMKLSIQPAHTVCHPPLGQEAATHQEHTHQTEEQFLPQDCKTVKL